MNPPPIVRLDAVSLAQVADAVADAVVERLTAREMRTADYMTAEEVAGELNVTPGWVYAHKRELGAERLGSGPKPRLRFPRARVEAFFAASSGCPPAVGDGPGFQRMTTRAARSTGSSVELLPIRGRSR